MSISRRLLLQLVALLGSTSLASRVLGQAPAATPTVTTTRVTFLLVNDFYLMNEQVLPDGRARGGFARLAAVVKGERAKAAQAGGGHVFFAHAGDTLSPSLMSGLDRGAHIIALTNMLGVDAFAPGNHEFDFGKAVFAERMAAANFPVYAANLRQPDGTPFPSFRDRAMLDFDGVRVGLTGGVIEDAPRTSMTEDLRFFPLVDAIKEQAATLRRDGADFVLTLMHAERGDSLRLADTRMVDLILTGHTHDLFVNFDGRTAIVESAYDAQYVTAIDVVISVQDREGIRTTTWWPRFRVIDTADVVPDPDVAAVAAGYESEFTREMDVPIGTTAVELDSRNATIRSQESALGNLFADAMRISTRSDAAVLNGGALRAGKLYPAGSEITRKDVMAELPFNNRVVVVQITGANLKQAIENGLVQTPLPAGRFPQVSGLAIEYDARRPPGSRVLSISVDGAPLEDGRRYRVAVIDFLARGGDGYTMFRDAVRITPDNDAPLLANALMSHVRRLGTVRPRIERRMVAR